VDFTLFGAFAPQEKRNTELRRGGTELRRESECCK
jgi:hypothetical protein